MVKRLNEVMRRRVQVGRMLLKGKTPAQAAQSLDMGCFGISWDKFFASEPLQINDLRPK